MATKVVSFFESRCEKKQHVCWKVDTFWFSHQRFCSACASAGQVDYSNRNRENIFDLIGTKISKLRQSFSPNQATPQVRIFLPLALPHDDHDALPPRLFFLLSFSPPWSTHLMIAESVSTFVGNSALFLRCTGVRSGALSSLYISPSFDSSSCVEHTLVLSSSLVQVVF